MLLAIRPTFVRGCFVRDPKPPNLSSTDITTASKPLHTQGRRQGGTERNLDEIFV